MIGRVYKITNADESIVYIGSTTLTIQKRWDMHSNQYKRWIDGKTDKACSIYNYFREHGIETFKIHLISEHTIEDQRHLHEFEQLVIDQTKCVNKVRAFRSEEQKIQYQQEYRQANKDQIQQYQQEYKDSNREHIREQVYALASQRTTCDCGLSYTRYHKERHLKTKRHQRLMEQQQA